MTRIKICGHRDAASALAAADAGADFVGFIFVPGSRRRLPRGKELDVIEAFRKARDGKEPRIVGVFANQPLEEVQETARAMHLDAVQLSGHEELGYCRRLRVPIIKTVHVREGSRQEQQVEWLTKELEAWDNEGYAVLLDRGEPGIFGGTGQTFDWTMAAELARRGHQFFLAGGLTPENVAEAVATVQPWGVDVSSGVETRGAKDPARIAAFIRAAREGEEEGRVERLRSTLSLLAKDKAEEARDEER